jgi:hypothetical protein
MLTPWAAYSLIPWFFEELAHSIFQFVKLLSVQS